MTLNADAVTLVLLAVLAVLVIGIIGYAVAARIKAAKHIQGTAAIRATIVEYFRRSGVTVAADCVLTEDGRYTALVESEPMKRFRLSHIIEMTLSEYVRKVAGVELDKIYWRFPVKEAVQAAAAPPGTTASAAPGTAGEPGQGNRGAVTGKPEEPSDEYINEGLEHYRHIPRPEVDELPWEAFEEVTIGSQKKEPPAS
jgi:type II secretory pathway pseudopilin PulG